METKTRQPLSRKPDFGLSFNFREAAQIIIKSIGLFVWICIFFLTLLEIKKYYNIDIVPGHLSPLKDTQGTFSELFRLFVEGIISLRCKT